MGFFAVYLRCVVFVALLRGVSKPTKLVKSANVTGSSDTTSVDPGAKCRWSDAEENHGQSDSSASTD
jgi:hypothetical protein